MDKNEFISLVLPLKDRLFRVAWCILRSKEEAEDIVQDVMLKVWRDEKGKVENLAAYCYTMARNLALNRLVLKDNRSKELEGAYEQEVQEQPLENIIRTEKMKLLYRMIDGLPVSSSSVAVPPISSASSSCTILTINWLGLTDVSTFCPNAFTFTVSVKLLATL